MKFTDIFIRRPVLATVVSLMILVLGLRAVFGLPVLQYPRTENAVVTVKHNGVIVQDHTELKDKTGAGAKDVPRPLDVAHG